MQSCALKAGTRILPSLLSSSRLMAAVLLVSSWISVRKLK